MGGKCAPGQNGWEIGVYGHEMTEAGRYWWTGDASGQGGNNRVVSNNIKASTDVQYIQQMVGGQITNLTTAQRSRPRASA